MMDQVFDFLFTTSLLMVVIFLAIIAGYLVVILRAFWKDSTPAKPLARSKKK